LNLNIFQPLYSMMCKTLIGLLLVSAAWGQTTLMVGDINDGSHDGWETKKSLALTEGASSITCEASGFWDQGWGYQKSRVRLALYDSQGNVLATEDCFGVAPHTNQGAVSKTFGCDSDLVSKTKAGTVLHVQTVVGGGGGHYIYVRGLKVELSKSKDVTLNVGTVTDNTHENWESKGSLVLSTSLMSVECKASSFYDQGWGYQKSRVRLALESSDGTIVATQDCFGVAPHQNQGAKSVTFDRSNNVVNMAKRGYRMHLQTYVGGGGGHMIFVTGLMAVMKTGCVESTSYVMDGVNGQTITNECGDWRVFRTLLDRDASYSRVTVSQEGKESFVCEDTTSATNICRQIATGNTFSVNCNGVFWSMGNCGSSSESYELVGSTAGKELLVSNSQTQVCRCHNGSDTAILRPCLGNYNWGGFRGATCGAPTQKITVTCDQGQGGQEDKCSGLTNSLDDSLCQFYLNYDICSWGAFYCEKTCCN